MYTPAVNYIAIFAKNMTGNHTNKMVDLFCDYYSLTRLLPTMIRKVVFSSVLGCQSISFLMRSRQGTRRIISSIGLPYAFRMG